MAEQHGGSRSCFCKVHSDAVGFNEAMRNAHWPPAVRSDPLGRALRRNDLHVADHVTAASIRQWRWSADAVHARSLHTAFADEIRNDQVWPIPTQSSVRVVGCWPISEVGARLIEVRSNGYGGLDL